MGVVLVINKVDRCPSQCIKVLLDKLMRLDQPQAKFRLKSDSNCLLIGFFNLIPAAQFTRRDDSIQIRTIIKSKSSILDRF